MQPGWNHLRPRSVGKKLFLTIFAFPVAAAFLAAIGIDWFGHFLTQEAYDTLDRQARRFAAVTTTRLTQAVDRLDIVATRLSHEGFEGARQVESVDPRFSALSYLDEQGRHTVLNGEASDLSRVDRHLIDSFSTDQTALAIARDIHGEPVVVLVRAVDSIAAGRGALLAELDSEHLWGARKADFGETEICVMDQDKALLFCARPPSDTVLEQAASQSLVQSDRPLRWKDGIDDEWLSAYSKLALRFPGAEWTVFASGHQPSTVQALAALVPAVAIMMCFTAPMVGLVIWTRARRVRKSRVESKTADNADKAAAAGLDAIHQKFERQAWMLAALSEMDRAILARAGVDRVVDLVLKNAPRVFNCQSAAVVLIDRDVPTRSRTISVGAGEPRARRSERSEISSETTQLLTSRPDGYSLSDTADCPFLSSLASFGAKHFELWPVFWDGSVSAILALGLTEPDALGPDARAYARDMADRLGVALRALALDEELRLQGQFDSTTALLNRRAFKDRLSQEIARTRRESRPIALLFIDIDRLKKVNDSAGHAGGDAVLEQASRRIKRCLREEDIVARFGGDEFAILLPGIAKATDAAIVADKLVQQLSQPYNLAGTEYFLSASIGICICPDDGQSVDLLLRNAALAMYRAKGEGGGQFAFFEERMNAQALDRAALEMDLRSALAGDQLILHFQPQIDLRTGRISGAEALIRWTHPKRGMVLPGAFIGVAEQSGLIEQIGEYVRRSACSQYSAWESASMAPPRVSINISTRELKRSDFIQRVEAVLRDTGVRPFCLEFEITESIFVDSSPQVETALTWLHSRGIRIAIDDFGTGYSSIAYLKRLPFDTLKLDRAFVKDIGQSPASDAIAATILGMAQNLGKEVVAEGVETAEQRDFLVSHGCDSAQGFLWSKPLSPHEFENLARDWKATPHARELLPRQPDLAAH